MKSNPNISPTIGEGVYSVPDAAKILGFPLDKVRRWVKTYWENKFLDNSASYTWGKERDRGFNFHTLVELIAIYALREENVSFHKIIKARKILQEKFDTEYPFASNKVMSDGDKFYYEITNTELLDVNLTQQLSINDMVEPYCNKLDFGAIDMLAQRFWPLGKDRDVVVDPHHRFGAPTIRGTNISVEVIVNMAIAGEKIETIANIYQLDPRQVRDAIAYHEDGHVAA